MKIYIARDDDGELTLFTKKPERYKTSWGVHYFNCDEGYMTILEDEDTLPEIKKGQVYEFQAKPLIVCGKCGYISDNQCICYAR